MKKYMLIALITPAFVGACTSTQKVTVSQPGDRNLSCAEIKSEFASLDVIMEDAKSDKGVNAANAAAILLFWPAAARNYVDASKAEDLVDRRREYLMGIYNEKNCDG